MKKKFPIKFEKVYHLYVSQMTWNIKIVCLCNLTRTIKNFKIGLGESHKIPPFNNNENGSIHYIEYMQTWIIREEADGDPATGRNIHSVPLRRVHEIKHERVLIRIEIPKSLPDHEEIVPM